MVSIIDLQDLFRTLNINDEDMNDLIPNTIRKQITFVTIVVLIVTEMFVHLFYVRQSKKFQKRNHMCKTWQLITVFLSSQIQSLFETNEVNILN